MEYYGGNDYRDYLAHHGILGMKWGKRNGPPYPLGPSDHSASEKKAGWKDSLKQKKQYEVQKLPEVKEAFEQLGGTRKELKEAYKERNKAVEAYNNLSYSDRLKLIDHAAYWNSELVANDRKEANELKKAYTKMYKDGDFSVDDFLTPFSIYSGANTKYGSPIDTYKGEYNPKRVSNAYRNQSIAEQNAVSSLVGRYGDKRITKLDQYSTVRLVAHRAIDQLTSKEMEHEEKYKFVKTYR